MELTEDHGKLLSALDPNGGLAWQKAVCGQDRQRVDHEADKVPQVCSTWHMFFIIKPFTDFITVRLRSGSLPWMSISTFLMFFFKPHHKLNAPISKTARRAPQCVPSTPEQPSAQILTLILDRAAVADIIEA